ncbi:MAG: Ig-like domain-containing protein [Chitinophagaceae bacterium]|nr:Ig-like domain-containing protein [Chitinophagaceae bacterium]
MQKTNVLWKSILVVVITTGITLYISSCKKEVVIDPALNTITIGSFDLNGVTAASTVPVNGTVTATFNKDIDVSSVNSTNITVIDYGDKPISTSLSVSGSTLSIVFANLFTGAGYTIGITNLKTTDGGTFPTITRKFATTGTFAPSGVVAFWDFEGADISAASKDKVGSYNVDPASVVDVTLAASKNDILGKAASFNGSTSYADIPNADQLMNTKDFTISFWVKGDGTNTHGNFVLGIAGWYGFQFEIAGDWTWVKLATQYAYGATAKVTSGSEDNWWIGSGSTKDVAGYNPDGTKQTDKGWQGWTFNKDVNSNNQGGVTKLFKNTWAHVVCTYESSTKLATMYVNGEKVKQHDFNLWPAGDDKLTVTGLKYAGGTTDAAKRLALGFIQAKNDRFITDSWADASVTTNNHFKGLLDNIRIFTVVVTADQAKLMYDSEK